MADQHASYLRAATPAAGRSRMRPLMAGALLAGAVLGGTGLAAALPGSLPEQAGSVAKSALAAVKLVDDDSAGDKTADKTAKEAAKAAKAAEKSAARAAGDADGPGKVVRFLAGCTAGTPPVAFVGNHGQYVKAHPDDPATAGVNERQVAAESDCGKPISALAEDDAATEEEKAAKAADEAAEAEDAENDKPADAGRPESPGKSEEGHPPATAVKERGSENRSTEKGKSGDAGSSADHRPEGVGPTTTAG